MQPSASLWFILFLVILQGQHGHGQGQTPQPDPEPAAPDGPPTAVSISTSASNTTTTTPPPPPPPAPGILPDINIGDVSQDNEATLKQKFGLKELNETCNVTITEKTRPGLDGKADAFMWYQDPCNKPRFRRFMHCNISTSRCECYKMWSSGIPMYENEGTFRDVSFWDDWMVFNHHAKECMVMPGKKCGVRGDITPYRCQKGLCTQVDEEDENMFVCSRGVLQVFNPSRRFILWTFIVGRLF